MIFGRFNIIYRMKLFVLARVADMRMLNFLDDLYHVLCLPFGYLSYLTNRLIGRPYFGIWLESSQGNPFRHKYLAKSIDVLIAGLRANGQTPATAKVRVLEIGAYAGASAIQWGLALKRHQVADAKVYSIDPWDSYLDLGANRRLHFRLMNHALAAGKTFQLFNDNIRAAGLADVCIPIKGQSAKVLPRFENASFDLIYIDGDHHVDAVKADIQMALRLLRDGGLLCGDDLEMQLADIDADFARRNTDSDMAVDPATGVAYHPGVTIAVADFFGRKIPCYEGYWVVRKNGSRLDDVRFDTPAAAH